MYTIHETYVLMKKKLKKAFKGRRSISRTYILLKKCIFQMTAMHLVKAMIVEAQIQI